MRLDFSLNQADDLANFQSNLLSLSRILIQMDEHGLVDRRRTSRKDGTSRYGIKK